MKRFLGWILGLSAVMTLGSGCGSSLGPGDGSGGASNQCGALAACGQQCVNTASDPANCGFCGNACPATAPFCSNSACSATCPTGQTACGNSCAVLASDPTHCGDCAIACQVGQSCNTGVCGSAAGGGPGAGGGSGVGGGVGTGGGIGVGGGASTGGVNGSTGGVDGGVGGGAPSGGADGSGGGDPGTDPPGYWRYSDWHGCSWTGVGKDGISTIAPQDFVAKPPADAYCVKGVVGEEEDYKSVALLGFNVNEPNTTTCEYKPVDVNADGPPSIVPTADGVAVNFVKQGADTGFTLRVQLQGPNGHKEGTVGDNDRWCATIEEVQGKVFVPYSAFTPKCWETTAEKKGTPYAKQPISAVVYLVPGSPDDIPYDFCINGFAYGSSAADAPDGPVQIGDQKGTVGGTGNDDLDFDRKKILVGGENYIIQNNNWGNPGGSDCILSFLNNSFNVTQCTGTGASAPAAFPSIYIGNNGNTANGVLSTKTTDNMPIQISQIANIETTFRYSGSSGGSYNACYDIWFANSPPTEEYKDGINGFVMVWLRDPSDKQAIGTQAGTANIAGQTWNVWVGPRGDGPAGTNNAPVVSFVNPTQNDDSRAQSFVNKNLLEFLTAASSHGIGSNMYLTDVFGGFEIWSGGSGLKVDEFKAIVTKK